MRYKPGRDRLKKAVETIFAVRKAAFGTLFVGIIGLATLKAEFTTLIATSSGSVLHTSGVRSLNSKGTDRGGFSSTIIDQDR